MIASRETDVLILKTLFGVKKPFVYEEIGPDAWYFIRSDKPRRTHMIDAEPVPHFSTDLRVAWTLVEAMQKAHPGWRFCLLGGDISFGYIDGNVFKGVDPMSRVGFGWRASFFGEQDPREDYGRRHADEWAETPALAICRAALAAVQVPA